MTFWSSAELEPLRKFRFQIQIGGDLWWWAKSVTQPSPDVSTSEYQLINHKIKYPGIVTWNDIDVSIVEVGEKGIELYKQLKNVGYNFSPGEARKDGILKKQKWDNSIIINKLDSQGNTLEVWTLHNAFIRSIKYGDLDYTSDDLVDITLTITYDSATLAKAMQTATEATPVEGTVTGAETTEEIEVNE